MISSDHVRIAMYHFKLIVMTKRKIRKLRKRIAKFEPYLVWRSWGLFGDFSGRDCVKIMADSHSHAVERYVRRKERQMKEMSDLRQCWFNETTRMFARVKVANKKGEKKYYL